MSQGNTQSSNVQTTGHVWDGDLQEYNNPLPAWWLWAFYLTIIFSITYWVMYPAWPIGKGFTTGMVTITYKNDKGVEKTTHWSTRALLMKDLQEAREKQKPYFDKVAAVPFEEIAKNPELSNFVASAGKVLFSDNCAACHMSGGQGKRGFAPSLVDDDWIYGGTYDKIQTTITGGRHGIMPAKGGADLNGGEIDSLANYVLSLSGNVMDAAKVKAGDELFHGKGLCFSCHGADGKGNKDIGSANLTDKIWLWADVKEGGPADKNVAAVKAVITSGLNKGVMPTWGGRLSANQIKLLTVYVHDVLGGGSKK
ncbi:MAG TPA: cytochrome-c oxidase, cbb3-type subunit III [Sulfuricella sp.]|nr:cytochrome-c oxidase, cbb3-type subunit III [Sulfuricella sp.]